MRLIDRVGLEDAGELVALATVDQLRRVFDEDVWRSARPGEEERFDAPRFTLWLEVMLEAGERFAADKLAELSEDELALALHDQILVLSLDELALLIAEGEGHVPLEKIVEDRPYLDFGDYRVVARRDEGWDPILAVLNAFDEWHSNTLQRLLERLCRVSSEYIYGQGGLWEVLTAGEMLESDAAADREERRARSGFVAAASARGFLAQARTDDVATLLRAPSRDPISRAFFRYYEAAPVTVAVEADAPEPAGLQELLGEAADDAPVRRLLPSGRDEAPAAQRLFARVLGELAARDPHRHEERIRELAYLANVLVAGVGVRGTRLRPLDAAEAALATCNLGLERAVANSNDGQARAPSKSRAVEHLERLSCDVLFRVGWRLLHDEVSQPAAAAIERLATRLARDTEAASERGPLERLAAAARAALEEGRPAALATRLDLLVDGLDAAPLARLAALSDELPALLSLDGATPERIAAAAQLGRARAFLESL
jgi:hypothetical protein